jgi:hypothetical protein
MNLVNLESRKVDAFARELAIILRRLTGQDQAAGDITVPTPVPPEESDASHPRHEGKHGSSQ